MEIKLPWSDNAMAIKVRAIIRKYKIINILKWK